MMYSNTAKKSNSKEWVFWAVQNSQICESEKLNSADFETFNICQNLSFL
jgi:hypothetical protein